MITYSQRIEECITARYSLDIAHGFIEDALKHLDGKFDECSRLQDVISELDILHLKVQCMIDKLVDEDVHYEL